MDSAIVVDANDVKKILAEFFHVPETAVIKSQYSWTVKGITGEQIDKLKKMQ